MKTKELGNGNMITITEKKGKAVTTIEVNSTLYNDDLMYQNVTLDTEYENWERDQYINLLKGIAPD